MANMTDAMDATNAVNATSAASTTPPETVSVPSASSGWLSAVLAVQTTTVPPEMVRSPLESKPSPLEAWA